jgi:hypothetical protein
MTEGTVEIVVTFSQRGDVGIDTVNLPRLRVIRILGQVRILRVLPNEAADGQPPTLSATRNTDGVRMISSYVHSRLQPLSCRKKPSVRPGEPMVGGFILRRGLRRLG